MEEQKTEQENTNTKSETPKSSNESKEEQKLQAMMGSSQPQEAKYIINTKGETVTFEEESYKPQVTLYFKNCEDCVYVVNSMCTKIMIEGCSNTKITFNKKVITNMMEIWKCNNLALLVNTTIGTFQTVCVYHCNVSPLLGHVEDMQSTELFKTLVWAGVHDLSLTFEDTQEHKLSTGFHQMKTQYPTIDEKTDQFITRFVKGNLLTEQIVRLKNGYPTTEREAAEFDRRQEEALQKLAQEVGITIGRKKPTTPKLKPNDPCHCGSNKKYKKCHGQLA